jgi:hypothetical protein
MAAKRARGSAHQHCDQVVQVILNGQQIVYRSFYGMRIPEEDAGTNGTLVLPHDVKGAKSDMARK